MESSGTLTFRIFYVPLPLSVAKRDDYLVKTNKAKFLLMLEDLQVDDSDASVPLSCKLPKGGVWIIDGMARLSQKSMPETFGKLSQEVLQ